MTQAPLSRSLLEAPQSPHRLLSTKSHRRTSKTQPQADPFTCATWSRRLHATAFPAGSSPLRPLTHPRAGDPRQGILCLLVIGSVGGVPARVNNIRRVSSLERQKPPTPVMTVIVLFALPTIFFFVAGIAALIDALVAGEPSMAGYGLLSWCLGLLPGAIAQGLWRGYRGSRNLACVIGVLGLPAGLLIVLLLTRPSSREWFHASAPPLS